MNRNRVIYDDDDFDEDYYDEDYYDEDYYDEDKVIESQEVDSIQNQIKREKEEKAIKRLFKVAYDEDKNDIEETDMFNALSDKYKIAVGSSLVLYSLILTEDDTYVIVTESETLGDIANYLKEEYPDLYNEVYENSEKNQEYDMEM